MGPKITIDSATLMNKGLEVIEARWLFDVGPERVEVVVHPQSIVHSLVEFCDSSVIAQLGLPDMRVPIAVALAHPERLPLDVPRLDLAAVGPARLRDARTPKRFPCLELAYRALRGDEAAPAVLNAANEVVGRGVPRRRHRRSRRSRRRTRAVLEAFEKTEAGGALRDLDDVIAADAWARARAREWLARGGGVSAARDVLRLSSSAFVLLLSILVFVHELGHFLVARACGVRVLKFSIGFGTADRLRPLAARAGRRNGTEYVIAWFPLGGFVKMLGENPDEIDDPEVRAAPGRIAAREDAWQKLAIVFAGPAANLMLPVLVFVGDARGRACRAPVTVVGTRRAGLARGRARACARATGSSRSRASP